jgi:hypothetical protein
MPALTSRSANSRHYNDANSPYDDDDNEKESKVQKAQDNALKHIFIILGIFVLALGAYEWSIGKTPSDAMDLVHQELDLVQQEISSPQGPNVDELAKIVQDLDTQVRARKATPGVLMEVDDIGLDLTGKLQEATRQLLYARYGKHKAYRVHVDVVFPPTIPDYRGPNDMETIVIELAPIELIPCSVFYFLELVRGWKKGSFHRNAGHVLQVQSRSDYIKSSMPFQEYSPQHPHKYGTVGYAGRPSGPGWYVSIKDNTKNHGPGSQQK